MNYHHLTIEERSCIRKYYVDGLSYREIARLIGMPGYARRVGHALAAAPAGLPCHRVVNSAGRTAPHWTEQRPMLEAEGVRFRKNGCVDLTRSGWKEVTL